MNTLEIILAAISIISFFITVFTLVQSKIKKVKDEANVEILREKLRCLHASISTNRDTVNAIIQYPKHRDMKVEELQDIARIARWQNIIILKNLSEYENEFNNWNFGEIIKSESNVIEDIFNKQHEDESTNKK